MRVFPLVLVVALPLSSFAQKRETIELQRDVSILQDNVRTLQRSLDEKIASLSTLVQQAIDNINKSNTSVAVLDNSLKEQIRAQLVAPVANLSAKMDQMSNDFQGVKASVEDLNEKMKRLDAKLADIKALVEVTRQPVAPAPGQPGGPPSGGPPQGLSAQATFDNAMRDKSSGNLDLALNEFGEFLKYFGNTELAPDAQFRVGEIYYQKSDFDNALKAFDLVLEKYPENSKTPDAIYMKGMTLLRTGQKTAAGREFQNVIQKYPASEAAPRARDQLKALGLRGAAPAPAAKKARKKK